MLETMVETRPSRMRLITRTIYRNDGAPVQVCERRPVKVRVAETALEAPADPPDRLS